jgi:hypothetical protein
MSGEKRGEGFPGSDLAEKRPVLAIEPTQVLSRKDFLPSDSEEMEEVEEVEGEARVDILEQFKFAEDFPQVISGYFAQYPNVRRGGSGVVGEGLVVFLSAADLLKREIARANGDLKQTGNQLAANLSEIAKEYSELSALLPDGFSRQLPFLGQVEYLPDWMIKSLVKSDDRFKSTEESSGAPGMAAARLNSLFSLYHQNEAALKSLEVAKLRETKNSG